MVGKQLLILHACDEGGQWRAIFADFLSIKNPLITHYPGIPFDEKLQSVSYYKNRSHHKCLLSTIVVGVKCFHCYIGTLNFLYINILLVVT